VAGVTSPVLARFARQKTVALTTYKRDGVPVATPVSVAVAGSRAYIRSYEKAWKVRRIRNNPQVALAPCTALGKPTGPAIGLQARRLQGAEATNAARLLARKYPMLHRIFVPSMHRLLRAKTGRTVHYELTTAEQPPQDGRLQDKRAAPKSTACRQKSSREIARWPRPIRQRRPNYAAPARDRTGCGGPARAMLPSA
jgi:PPOX class probable F420-dependent enzyme